MSRLFSRPLEPGTHINHRVKVCPWPCAVCRAGGTCWYVQGLRNLRTAQRAMLSERNRMNPDAFGGEGGDL